MGAALPGIDDAFVVANRNEDATLVKGRPILDHKRVNLVVQCQVKMVQVELVAQLFAVLRLVICEQE